MAKIKDLTGQVFGKLTVIKRDLDTPKGKPIRWICKCECGKIKSIQSNNLKNGLTKSCGCLQKANVSNNLLNKRFGKLLVIEKTEKRTSQRNIIWKCKCDCGNITYVSTNNLIQNITMSCGCLKQSHGEFIIENYFKEHNILYKKEVCFPELLSKKQGHLRFDFVVYNKKDNSINSVIEFDGETHSVEHLGGWNTYEKVLLQQQNDEIKNNYCKQHQLKLIRISNIKDIENILNNFDFN